MVFLVIKVLLAQIFFAFHVQASNMTAILADAKATLSALLQKESKQLCGSADIYNLLTLQANKRVTLWDKIFKIADQEVDDLQRLLDETEAQLNAAKAEYKKLTEEGKPQMSVADFVPMITKALHEANFAVGGSEADAVNNAIKSKCGKLVGRRLSRAGVTNMDGNAYDNSLTKFEALVTERMSAKDVRMGADEVWAACEDMTLVPMVFDFCEEMCTKMGQAALRISDAAVGQTAGGLDKVQKKVDELTALYKGYLERQTKCSDATNVLKNFRDSLLPLEQAIDETFEAWRKAQNNIQAAEIVLDQLMADLEKSKELTAQWKKKADTSAKNVADAQKALDDLIKSELFIKLKWKVAKRKLADAQEKMAKTDDALKAAEAIKMKITGIIEDAIMLYDWFVHEPLRNLQIDIDGTVDEVFYGYLEDETNAKTTLTQSLQALTSYCEKEAGPTFAKIQSVDLSPLCQIPDAQSIFTVFEQRKTSVKGDFDYCLSFKKNFFSGAVESTNELSAPLNLNQVTDAFPTPTFSSTYLPQWETDGKFLAAIKKLRETIAELEDQSAGISSSIAALSESLKKNVALSQIARAQLKKAIEENNAIQMEKKKAEELLAAQEEEEEQQNANLDELDNTADALRQKYVEAVQTFNKHFIAGTSLSLLQQKEKTNSFLKPVKKVV